MLAPAEPIRSSLVADHGEVGPGASFTNMKTGAFRILIASIWAAGCFGHGALAASDKPQNSQSAAGKSTPPQPSPAQAKAETPAVLIDDKRVESVLGKEIRSGSGETLGNVTDILVDSDGSVRAAIIDFGGFLGVGSRKIVVDWAALHFGGVTNKSDSITLDLTKEQVMAAPEYKEGTPIVVLGAAGSLKPWQYDHQ